MRRAAALLMVGVVVSGQSIAQSLTRQQSNAANHLAQVMAIELECPEYEANMVSLALLMSGYKLDIGSEPLASRMRTMVAEHRAGLKVAGQKIGCLVGWGLYGPGGENVKNLIRRK